MKRIALFDIADGAFHFYTELEWDEQIQEWRSQLESDGLDGLTVDEIVSCMGGDEYFWSVIE